MREDDAAPGQTGNKAFSFAFILFEGNFAREPVGRFTSAALIVHRTDVNVFFALILLFLSF